MNDSYKDDLSTDSNSISKISNDIEIGLTEDDRSLLEEGEKFIEPLLEKFPIFFKSIMSERYDDVDDGLRGLYSYVLFVLPYVREYPSQKKNINFSIPELPSEIIERIQYLSLLDPNLPELKLENTIYHPKLTPKYFEKLCLCILSMYSSNSDNAKLICTPEYILAIETKLEYVETLVLIYRFAKMDIKNVYILYQKSHFLQTFESWKPENSYITEFIVIADLFLNLNYEQDEPLQSEYIQSSLIKFYRNTHEICLKLERENIATMLRFYGRCCMFIPSLADEIVTTGYINSINSLVEEFALPTTDRVEYYIMKLHDVLTNSKELLTILLSKEYNEMDFVLFMLNKTENNQRILNLIYTIFLKIIDFDPAALTNEVYDCLSSNLCDIPFNFHSKIEIKYLQKFRTIEDEKLLYLMEVGFISHFLQLEPSFETFESCAMSFNIAFLAMRVMALIHHPAPISGDSFDMDVFFNEDFCLWLEEFNDNFEEIFTKIQQTLEGKPIWEMFEAMLYDVGEFTHNFFSEKS